MDSKVGWTVTSFEVENSILSSALRSMPPSAIVAVLSVFRDDGVKRLKLGFFSGGIMRAGVTSAVGGDAPRAESCQRNATPNFFSRCTT